MLILTKKYELIEINLTRFIVVVLALTALIALITSRITDIPNSINIALNLPLGLIATGIWEFLIKKPDKIFDRNGLSDLLSKISEGDSKFVKDFCSLFLSKIKTSKRVIEVPEEKIIGELVVICNFIQSSFFEFRYYLTDARTVSSQFKEITAKGSVLEKRFKIKLSNLAFLYETNIQYLYHNYQIGSDTKLHYKLQNESLLKQKQIRDHPILNVKQDIFIDNEIRADSYMTRYVSLVKQYFYNYSNTEQYPITRDKEFFMAFYQILKEINKNPDYATLSLHISYDLIGILNFQENISVDEALILENVTSNLELRKKLEENFHAHPVVNFLYLSSWDYRLFKDNVEEFSFSDLYSQEISSIHTNELNRAINDYDSNSFIQTYREYKNKCITYDYNVIYDPIYEVFYNYFAYKKEISFNHLDILDTHENSKYLKGLRVYAEEKISLLKKISEVETSEEIADILRHTFPIVSHLSFLKGIPIYFYNTFLIFSKYIKG